MSFTPEADLTAELRELEQQLAGLEPSALTEDLLARMEQSVNHQQHPIDEEGNLDELEVHLGQMAPSSMPMDMLGRMTRAMDRWHEHVPVEEKVVSFGGRNPAPVRRQFGAGMLSAAAAVAMLGAVTALVLPRFFHPAQSVGVVATDDRVVEPDFEVTTVVEPRDAWLLPDSLSHKVTNTSDRGIVMTRDNIPHRCIRVDYVDRLKVQDEEGREIEIERPSVDIMLFPVETY
jgi:hypothetical protein